MHTNLVLTPKEYEKFRQLHTYDPKRPLGVVATYTATFTNGYEVDLNVCQGATEVFIDPVLFDDDGFEINAGPYIYNFIQGQTLDVKDEEMNNRYSVTLKVAINK